MFKNVIYLLDVPEGSYCYYLDKDSERVQCDRLVFSGGVVSCLMDFEPEKEDGSINVLKDKECFELENLEE